MATLLLIYYEFWNKMTQNALLCIIFDCAKKESKKRGELSLHPLWSKNIFTFTCPGNKDIDVSVYNTKGERIKTIAKRFFPPGIHRFVWDGLDNCCQELTQGTFEIRCDSGDTIQKNKIIKMHIEATWNRQTVNLDNSQTLASKAPRLEETTKQKLFDFFTLFWIWLLLFVLSYFETWSLGGA